MTRLNQDCLEIFFLRSEQNALQSRLLLEEIQITLKTYTLQAARKFIMLLL